MISLRLMVSHLLFNGIYCRYSTGPLGRCLDESFFRLILPLANRYRLFPRIWTIALRMKFSQVFLYMSTITLATYSLQVIYNSMLPFYYLFSNCSSVLGHKITDTVQPTISKSPHEVSTGISCSFLMTRSFSWKSYQKQGINSFALQLRNQS